MIDSTTWQVVPHLTGKDDEESRLLCGMGDEALAYVASFAWAPPIRRAAMAFGVGGVIALFLIEFTEPVAGTEAALWVVAGDLPSAYFVTENVEDTASAIAIYCDLMQDSADAVLAGQDLADVFPVDAPPAAGNAAALNDRLRFVRENIVPMLAL